MLELLYSGSNHLTVKQVLADVARFKTSTERTLEGGVTLERVLAVVEQL